MSDASSEPIHVPEGDAPKIELLDLAGRRMSGEPAFGPLTIDEMADRARREPIELQQLELARQVFQGATSRLLVDGVDPCRPEQAGWGVVFPAEGKNEIREALAPLLDWRRTQATVLGGSRFRDLNGEQGYRYGETLTDFLDRHRASCDVVDPRRFPYYLLLVGSPEEIPFAFQSQLDLQHGVGRLDFNTPDEYATYAISVVETEERQTVFQGDRRAVFFCPTHDSVTERIAQYLVKPLLGRFEIEPVPGWTIEPVVGEAATRQRLLELLGGTDCPDLLFTAGHGVFCEATDPFQRAQQGGLWCQDGPVIAADLACGTGSQDLIAFHFACFGAGTDHWDEFETEGDASPIVRAERPFTARLPQSLLNSGALAVLGHVGRSWTSSFIRKGRVEDESQPGSPLLETFAMTIQRLLRGVPVGHALEPFNVRYAAEMAKLADLNFAHQFGASTSRRHAEAFRSYLDARNFIVIGDPMARVPRLVANL